MGATDADEHSYTQPNVNLYRYAGRHTHTYKDRDSNVNGDDDGHSNGDADQSNEYAHSDIDLYANPHSIGNFYANGCPADGDGHAHQCSTDSDIHLNAHQNPHHGSRDRVE